MSQLLLDGVGFGLSSFTNTGTLNALPKAIQLPGCNTFNRFIIYIIDISWV